MQISEGKSLQAWILLLTLSVIWGCTFILNKRGLIVYSPGEVGAIRIAAAGLVLLPFALRNLRTLNKKQWFLLFIIGLCGSFIPAFLFAKAQTQLDSAITGAVNALTPVFTLILGALFFKQKFTARNAIGLGIAFFGTIWLGLVGKDGGVGELNFYVFFVVLATVLYGINLNVIKAHLADVKPLVITSISLFIVLPLSLGYLFGMSDFYEKYTYVEGATYAFGLIVLLGIMGTAIALIMFNHMVQISTPIFASSVTYIIPIVAIAIGVWDGENLLVEHYMGMMAVVVGVYISNRK